MSKQATTETVALETPIERGDNTITEIAIRKPMAGELRGVSLTELMQMDVAALSRVLPRITQPTLTEPEIAKLDPVDLVQMGSVVTNFLLPKWTKAAS